MKYSYSNCCTMYWKRTFLITVFVLGVNSQEGIAQDQIIETEYGKVKGTYRFALGSHRPVYSYFGIRYGRRPDYVFRFRPAEEPWTWDGLFDATNENRPLCFQDSEHFRELKENTYFKFLTPEEPKLSEDCLLLDVFSPVSTKEINTGIDLLPVVVWIHGGSFQKFASTTKLWAMSAYEDVVLVQIQYRVGPFGFLTTDDSWAPANCALHDQLKALNWIKRNIEVFGGNPEAVTIMGESAGSVAVTTLMLSSASKNLFHRAIAISGAPDTMLWEDSQMKSINRIAKRLNCHFDNNSYKSTCLRNKINSKRIVDAARKENITFTLQKDEVFMPESPRKLIDAKSFGNSVPLVIGTTSGEMDYVISRRSFKETYDKGSKVTRSDVVNHIRDEMEKYYPDGNINNIMKLIEKSYLKSEEVGNKGINLLRGMLNALADQKFVSRGVNFADKLKETGQQVYFFEFAHKPSMYKAKAELFPRKYNWTSADHGDELPFLLGLPFIAEFSGKDAPLVFTNDEKNLSKNIMKFVARFAATGKPMSEWSQYPDYMLINESFTMKNQPYKPEQMDIWNEIIPSLL